MVDVTFEHNEDDPVHIEADRDQISRVYINLITNAIQAIPENRKGAVKLTLKTYEDVVITEIKDNGVGIGKEDEDKIFVPNFTTKSTGTGLGLAMVKNIVINTGGDIWFKSKKGEGSSFFVSFPLIK